MAEQTKTEIKKLNRGDLALTHSLEPGARVDAATIMNITNFKRNVLPGYVVDKKNPSKDYATFWWREGTDETSESELDDLIEAGYFFCNEKDFTVKKWNRTADGKIRSGRFLLLLLPEEIHEERRLTRLRHLGGELDSASNSFDAAADKLGLGTWEVRGGRYREGAKARTNTPALLD